MQIRWASVCFFGFMQMHKHDDFLFNKRPWNKWMNVYYYIFTCNLSRKVITMFCVHKRAVLLLIYWHRGRATTRACHLHLHIGFAASLCRAAGAICPTVRCLVAAGQHVGVVNCLFNCGLSIGQSVVLNGYNSSTQRVTQRRHQILPYPAQTQHKTIARALQSDCSCVVWRITFFVCVCEQFVSSPA